MKKEEARWQKVVALILMLLLSSAVTAGAAYLYGKSFREIFFLMIITFVCYGCTIFTLVESTIYQSLHFDNHKHYVRFAFIFTTGTIASCLFPLLPYNGWVFPVLALALTLFSNTLTGITAYAGMLGVCVFLAGADSFVYIMYLFLGIMFSVLFDKLDHEYKTGAPTFISAILYATFLLGKTVFETYGALNFEVFMMPLINIFITFILVLAVLRFYCAVVIDREKGKYLDINDQEFELLAKYKEEDAEVYYNAIHTAYFAEKIARARNMDVDLAKNGGYYHRIIANECKNRNQSLEELCQSYYFPPKAIQLLQEYNYKSKAIELKETAVVHLADAVVTSIMYILQKEENKDVDCGKVALAVFKRKLDSGVYNKSELSLADIKEIEKIWIGEKLYYDFLRRK